MFALLLIACLLLILVQFPAHLPADPEEREYTGYPDEPANYDIGWDPFCATYRSWPRKALRFLKNYVESFFKLFGQPVSGLIQGDQVSLILVRQLLFNLLFGRGILHG